MPGRGSRPSISGLGLEPMSFMRTTAHCRLLIVECRLWIASGVLSELLVFPIRNPKSAIRNSHGRLPTSDCRISIGNSRASLAADCGYDVVGCEAKDLAARNPKSKGGRKSSTGTRELHDPLSAMNWNTASV